jgi:NADH:ubiquinone oxidoreductase subunit 4 (subunit M)
VEELPWVPGFGIKYLIGVDGVSLFLVLLTTFLTPIVILFSFGDVTTRVNEVLLLPAAPRDRDARRVLRARCTPVLCIL